MLFRSLLGPATCTDIVGSVCIEYLQRPNRNVVLFCEYLCVYIDPIRSLSRFVKHLPKCVYDGIDTYSMSLFFFRITVSSQPILKFLHVNYAQDEL